MKKRITIITVVVTIFVLLLLSNNIFKASIIKRKELTNINLYVELYDVDGTKIYLKENDVIEILNNYDDIINYKIDNGSVVIQAPLYEKDVESTGNIKKEIKLDNSIHNTIVEEKTFINTYNASKLFLAYKNNNDLLVEMDDYYIFFDNKYESLILKWYVIKELDQIYENENYNMELVITTEELYETPEIEGAEGNSNIPAFYSPVEYRSVEIVEDEDMSYLKLEVEASEIVSIWDGVLIEANDIDNYVAIKYNDGLIIKYSNIIPVVKDSEVKRNDIIGYCFEDTLDIYSLDNGNWIAAEWIYDGFERPEEGVNCPRMYQMDYRWANLPYGYNTIGGGGCGPSSFAMVISGLTGRTYTPEDIVEIIQSRNDNIWYYQQGSGSTYAIFPYLCNYFDLNIDDGVVYNEESLKSYIEDNKVVIISISSGNVYTGQGHFVVLRGLTEDGKFLVNDSANYFDLNTGYSYEDLIPIQSARCIWKD